VEERRDAVRRAARALSAAVAGVAACAAAACDLPPGTRVESERLAVSYWTLPQTIAVGKPFVVELAVCPRRAGVNLERVKLDAHMPEHRHGMNYRVKVVSLGTGRFHSEGWMFHMPGRWEFVFDLGSDRLTHSVRVE
jgi:hypothetical protein